MNFCPLCQSMEEIYLIRVPHAHDEETENCEVLDNDE